MREIPIPNPAVPISDSSAIADTSWWDYWNYLLRAVRSIQRGGEPAMLPRYTVATLPAAADWAGAQVIVTNDVGGQVPAWSDGINWRRVTDRAVVS